MIIKKVTPILLWMLPFLEAGAQSPEAVYQQPLKTVLEKIQQQYKVTLVYEDKNIKDKVVNYATWRLVPDVKTTLDNVLKPLDLVYKQKGSNEFEISKYEYFRRSEAEGRQHLDQLLKQYTDATAFDQRRTGLRASIFAALGIQPQLERPPLHTITGAKRKMKGYTVENVAFESLPGYYVTGTLYTPDHIKGKIPVILSPHGHFYNKIDVSIPNERGRYRPDMQYRCAALAKMGAAVFSYDMYAWGESVLQTGNKSWHRTGFALAMQTWNSMRVLDFLLGLSYADPARVGITGASGGGTQTFLLAALDDRVTASAPVVMVSSAFYGGCPCESGLPIHEGCNEVKTNNAEIAALFAPKPQLVISDGNDWTQSVPGTDFPYLQTVYGFYNQRPAVRNVHLPDDEHDYGFSKRVPMYRFFADVFGLNIKPLLNAAGNIDESNITIQPAEQLLSFGPDGKLPSGALHTHAAIVAAFNRFHQAHHPAGN
ncbi:acetylxylan esterase [Niabella sp.]|uniref:acetylxylan esterase n=1 Tax=Niabella sp. TaxID=1962976 RepID=UPI0026274223|nr:acetylxylan esterase [Niabella sp.]